MSNGQERSEGAAYIVTLRGHDVEVKCETVEQVVEAVKALAPLEREIAVPRTRESDGDGVGNDVAQITPTTDNPVARAVYDLYRAEPRWRRPVEIIKALRKRNVPRADATYNRVYSVLRYGDFVRQHGRWNTKDSA